MPKDSEKPLAPNVKGGPDHKPYRLIETVNGNGRIVGDGFVQQEGRYTVTYHRCVFPNVNCGEPPVVDLASCLVTWE